MKIKVILNDREECLLDVEDVWKRDYIGEGMTGCT